MKDIENKILNITSQLIAEKGLPEISMQMIADETGFGTGTIYRYFMNKEKLLEKLHEKLKNEFIESLMVGINPSLPVKSNFMILWKNIVNYNLKNPHNICCMDTHRDDKSNEFEIKEMYEIFIPKIYKIISKAVKEKIIRDIPIEIMATFTYQSAIGVAKKIRNKLLNKSEIAVEAAAEMCWNGLTEKKLNKNGMNIRSYFTYSISNKNERKKIYRSPSNNSFKDSLLQQNYPNPFGCGVDPGDCITTIKYTVPQNTVLQKIPVCMTLFANNGDEIATLIDEEQPAGNYEFLFDASLLSNGSFTYQLNVCNRIEHCEMLIIG